jgi:cytochrome c
MNVKTMIAWIIIVCALFAYGCTELIANDKIFNKCKACHGFEKNKLGPHLQGIVGRQVGSVEGYKYSKALLNRQSLRWTEDNLRAWLTKPKSFIPKTKMMFPGIKKKAELDQLIEYLKTK